MRKALLRWGAIGLLGVLTTLALAAGAPAAALGGVGTAVAAAPFAARRVRSTRRERDRHLAEVAARLHHVDAVHRDAQARMHAIRSIVAGIVAATQLLRSLPEDRRDSFESMVDAELDRLTRLLRDDSTPPVGPIAVDDLLAPLVVSHRSRGRAVRWEPSGLSVLGRYDDVAETVNILLDNAAVHGTADDIRVVAERCGPEVVISVTDGGAGVPVALRDRIFRWGERRPGSPGEGIGLNFAQTLVRGLAGDLALDDGHRPGARFVLRLPAPATLTTAASLQLPIAG